MPSSLTKLVTSAPSGRTTPLLIDSDDYALRVVRQGSPIPWFDLAALTGHVGQVTSLLNPDAVWIDVADLYAAHVQEDPALIEAMGAKSRGGYALRTLLGHETTAEKVTDTIATVGRSARRPIVLDIPSPARWLGRAHAVAGTALEEVSPDHADSASMYLAEWLGRLGGVDVALLHLDATPADGDSAVSETETLSEYTSITNVAGHFGWTTALRDGATVTATDDEDLAVLPDEYWTGEGGAPQAGALLTHIPAEANPEDVLSRLAALG